MSCYGSGPIHTKAHLTKPRLYRTTVANPPKFPRLVVLRSTCGHRLGIGYVWRHQGFLSWRACR